ncbi:MAG: hypothetical protein ACW98W_20505 [Candidatus Hodarchaeales archaeon]
MDNQKHDRENNKEAEEQRTTEQRSLEKMLEVTAWGLFFIWVGVAFLTNLSFAVGLLGVGIITLVGQLARKYFNLKIEGFWIVVGLLFVIGGIWDLLDIKFQLVPILIIIAGLVMIISVIRSKRLVK